MLIFKDVVSGNEMFTDVYPQELLCDGHLIKITCKRTTESGGIAESLIGGNKSQEACDDEGADDSSTTEINVVRACKMQLVSQLDKKQFMAWLKPYCKAVKEKLNGSGEKKLIEQAATFEKGAQATAKFLLAKIKGNELDFYLGEKGDPDAGMGFLDYAEDGVTPIMYFMKYAFIEEKV